MATNDHSSSVHKELLAIIQRHELNAKGEEFALAKYAGSALQRQEELAVIRRAWFQSTHPLTSVWRQVLSSDPQAPAYYRLVTNHTVLAPSEPVAWLDPEGEQLWTGQVATIQPLTCIVSHPTAGTERTVLWPVAGGWLFEVLQNPRLLLTVRMAAALEVQALYERYLPLASADASQEAP